MELGMELVGIGWNGNVETFSTYLSICQDDEVVRQVEDVGRRLVDGADDAAAVLVGQVGEDFRDLSGGRKRGYERVIIYLSPSTTVMLISNSEDRDSIFLALYAVAESSPLVGSSRYMMAGLVTASMPRLSRRFSPPAQEGERNDQHLAQTLPLNSS